MRFSNGDLPSDNEGILMTRLTVSSQQYCGRWSGRSDFL